MQQNNYDRVASLYDRLSRLVFQRSQVDAQVSLLQYIPAGSQLLIVGGGTGWILEHLPPQGLTVTYVEISANMIALSRKRNLQQNTVVFIHLPVESFVPQHDYDVIITPFLFDNFAPERAQPVFRQLHHLLRKDGMWLFTDFEKSRWWHKVLLKTMYTFFRLVAAVEAKSLYDMSACFQQAQYERVYQGAYYMGFIQAIAYRKTV
jgi:ubiquinone/menaquinone biosynthesis C-methylase UbiE